MEPDSRYEQWTVRTMESPQGIPLEVSRHFLEAVALEDVTATDAINEVVRRYRLGDDGKGRPGRALLWWRGCAVAVLDVERDQNPEMPAHASRGPLRIEAYSHDVARHSRQRR